MVKKKVRKSTRKHSTTRKVVKNHSSKFRGGNSSVTKKDFEAFKFGIDRLKELRVELNSLDTRGFSSDEQKIRRKLKSVSEIPNIEREIKSLKRKIKDKHGPKRKRKSPTKEIKADLKDIQEDLDKLRRMHKKSDSVKIDSGVDVLVDTNFNSFLNSTKKALSERIHSREEEMDNILQSDLEKREYKYKRKHDILLKDFGKKAQKLEDNFNKKLREVEEKSKKLDRNFEDKSVKLNKQVEERSDRLDKQFERKVSDIDKKEKMFESSLNKKYKQKVASELHKEVSQSFNQKLKEKLDKVKVALTRNYKIELKKHSDDILKRRKDELENDLIEKREKFEKYRDDERRKMWNKLLAQAHKKIENDLAKKEAALRSQLNSEYQLKLKKQIEEHEQEIKQKKLDLELEMQKKIKQLLS